MAKERTELRHRTAAMIDPLTGMSNRRAFFEEAQQLLKRPPFQSVAVLVIDLDNFKSINDRYGHAVGDRVLQVFAETAAANLRKRDRIGRLGGEEFGVILNDTGPDLAAHLGERIRIAFSEAGRDVEGRPVRATLSVGLVVTESDAELDQLLAHADQALYLAKELGRNRTQSTILERTPPGETETLQPIGCLPAKTAA
jgi:diguanylate cyclase (GGDEF)-like protein